MSLQYRGIARALAALAVALALRGEARADAPWIGVEVEPSAAGLRVKRVMQASPGAAAGLAAGDELVTVDGQKPHAAQELIALVRAHAAGDVLRLSLAPRRAGGPPREVRVKLAARPDPADYQRTILVGKPAPAIAPKVVSGPKVQSLAALRGKVVLLDFWASWCGPCMASLPSVQALSQRLADRGLVVLGVTTDPAPLVLDVAQKKQLTYPLAVDETEAASGAFQVYALPTAFVIDRAGVVRGVFVADLEGATAAIEALLRDAPPR